MFSKNTLTLIEILIVLIVIAYLFFQIDMQKYGQYIQSSSILIFSITAFIGILTYMNQVNDRSKMLGIQYANLTQSKMNEIDKLFLMNHNLNRLYFQMYQDDPHIIKIIQMSGFNFSNETPEILKAEHHTSNIIFQTIADIYACDMIKETIDGVEWFNTFKQWMKSSILRSHWQVLQKEQHPDVRKFITSLITGNTFYLK